MDDHHSGLTTRDVWYALVRLVEVWEKAGCDCCAPTPLDEALGDMDSVPGLAERVRRVGIDMAQAGQWGVERLAEESDQHSEPGSNAAPSPGAPAASERTRRET